MFFIRDKIYKRLFDIYTYIKYLKMSYILYETEQFGKFYFYKDFSAFINE